MSDKPIVSTITRNRAGGSLCVWAIVLCGSCVLARACMVSDCTSVDEYVFTRCRHDIRHCSSAQGSPPPSVLGGAPTPSARPKAGGGLGQEQRLVGCIEFTRTHLSVVSVLLYLWGKYRRRQSLRSQTSTLS